MGFFRRKQKVQNLIREDIPLSKINTLEPYSQAGDSLTLKKGDEIISLDDEHFLKRRRTVSRRLGKALDEATLDFMESEAYMHYMKDGLEKDIDDPEYKEQAVFFWGAAEVFSRKSLPPHFETFDERYFRITGEKDGIGVVYGEVAPWFGQPGGGTKYFFTEGDGDHQIPLEEIEKKGIIEYFHFIELTEENSEVLTDSENNYFLTNGQSLEFTEGWPEIGGNQIPISLAYECGLFDIVSRKK
jgi:hypothetical protein